MGDAIGVVMIWGAIELRKVLDDAWLLGLDGVLSIAFGVILLTRRGALALVWMIGWFAVVFGIIHIALAFRLKRVPAAGLSGRLRKEESRAAVMLLIRAAYRMPHQTTKIGRRSPLVSILAITFFLCAFGFIAQAVSGGKTSAFDRRVILALRDSADPSVPLGPAWLQEAARDVTSLGSIVVLAIITLAAVGYLFLARKQVAAWLMLIAVFGGIALNDLLKAAFARPRPDIVTPCGAGFHHKFPKRPCRTVCDHLFDGRRLSRLEVNPHSGWASTSCRWRHF